MTRMPAALAAAALLTLAGCSDAVADSILGTTPGDERMPSAIAAPDQAEELEEGDADIV